MEIDSSPVEIDELRRAVDRLRMEELHLGARPTTRPLERLERLRQDLADKSEQLAALNARWEAEKSGLNRVGELKARIDDLRTPGRPAAARGRLREGVAAALRRDPRAGEASSRRRDAEAQPAATPTEGSWSRSGSAPTTSPRSSAPGPASRPAVCSRARPRSCSRMESIIGARLIGQERAVQAVSDAVRRSRAGLGRPQPADRLVPVPRPDRRRQDRARQGLADFLFDDERAMVRIDMSEYSERHSVARLIGAPPGYVGYEEGGQLTEAVRRRPYSVVLLDEVEKAHPETFDILLQVLDDGRLTDGQGRTVDFRNVILVHDHQPRQPVPRRPDAGRRRPSARP